MTSFGNRVDIVNRDKTAKHNGFTSGNADSPNVNNNGLTTKNDDIQQQG